ncbi:hypothetical protein [Hasllibacter sp. MH4015]|uniref:hypothetical protein n=1 Tax=Hasllibacter sp. MH4015 TaxID=2854029 RepID=UPI001CD70433|nr:hypothetical protein [Hasllibacter sp. MH4015]
MFARLILFAPLIVTGCMAQSVYYSEGVSVGRRDADLAMCEGESLARYPIVNETRLRAPTFIPATETCDATGACTRTDAYFEPGEPYTVDINADFRRQAIRGCMGDNGYDRIDLPYCEQGTAVTQTTVMPRLTGDTCLLRRGPGTPLVVNPAR